LVIKNVYYNGKDYVYYVVINIKWVMVVSVLIDLINVYKYNNYYVLNVIISLY